MPLPTPVRLLALAASLAGFTTLAVAPAGASIADATAIDGPSADIIALDGVAMAEDGTGGLVYRKRVAGRTNVFVSRFTAQGWQPPRRVDVGQAFNSSWPAIGAGNGGRLVVTWVHEFGANVQNRMYSAVLGPGATRFQDPVAVDLDVREGLDAYPSLSMSRGGAAYLTYRVVYSSQDPNLPPGFVDADVRLARFAGSFWSVFGQPVDRNPVQPVRTPTALNGPRVATDAAGNAVVAWTEPDDELIDRVYARRIFGATPGFVLQASPGGDPGAEGRPLRAGPDQFDLALSPFGEAAIAYRQLPASGASFTRPRAYVNLLPSVFSEKAGAFVGIKAVDTGGADGPTDGLGTVRVGVDDQGGFTAAVGRGVAGLLVPGDELSVGEPERLDEGGSVTPPDPFVERGPDGALAASYSLSDAAGAAGVGLLQRNPEATGERKVVATESGGPVSTLLSDGSGLGDAAIAFLQGEEALTTIAATSVDAPPGGFSVATPPEFVRTRQVELTWDEAPAGVGAVRYELLIDGQDFGKQIKGLERTVSAREVGDGDHEVVVAAVDAGGQRTRTEAASLKIDLEAPRVRLTAPGRSRRATVRLADGTPGEVSGVAASRSTVAWGDGRRA
ncbi:MAG: hypothetical protein H0V81_05365, partial [Solirubrobacterales bacterium]|nr:hypothetical protein [Solirubrobacterales bacterium]